MYYLLLDGLDDEGKDAPFIEAVEPEICNALVRQQAHLEKERRLAFHIDTQVLQRDYQRIPNLGGGRLCSQRFLEILMHASVPYRAYPTALRDIVTGNILSTDHVFWIPEEKENGIDWEHSEFWIEPLSGFKRMTKLVLTPLFEASAPPVVKMKAQSHILVNEDIRLQLLKAGITGLAFAPLDAVYIPHQGIQKLELEQQLRDHPDDWTRWYKLSEILWFLHRDQESLAAIDRALMIETNIAVLWLRKGSLLSRLGQTQEAIGIFKQALQQDPRSLAWGEYCSLLQREGKKGEALVAAQHFVQMRGDTYISWQALGNAYVATGSYEEALQAFEKALQRGKGSFWGIEYLYAAQGKALFHLGRYEEAIAAYNQPLLQQSQDSAIWRDKAHLLHSTGYQEQAQEAEKRVQELEMRKKRN